MSEVTGGKSKSKKPAKRPAHSVKPKKKPIKPKKGGTSPLTLELAKSQAKMLGIPLSTNGVRKNKQELINAINSKSRSK